MGACWVKIQNSENQTRRTIGWKEQLMFNNQRTRRFDANKQTATTGRKQLLMYKIISRWFGNCISINSHSCSYLVVNILIHDWIIFFLVFALVCMQIGCKLYVLFKVINLFLFRSFFLYSIKLLNKRNRGVLCFLLSLIRQYFKSGRNLTACFKKPQQIQHKSEFQS